MSGFLYALSGSGRLASTNSKAAGGIGQRAVPSAMPTYQCCFLDERGRAEEIVSIRAVDDAEAQQKAMAQMTGDATYASFELWNEGRMVITYKPTQDRALEGAGDPVARQPRARSAAISVVRRYRPGQA
jgi:hypothetical protein